MRFKEELPIPTNNRLNLALEWICSKIIILSLGLVLGVGIANNKINQLAKERDYYMQRVEKAYNAGEREGILTGRADGYKRCYTELEGALGNDRRSQEVSVDELGKLFKQQRDANGR